VAALHRKLGRDIRASLGMLVTVVAIIAVGTGSFVGLASAHRTLTASQAAYYREYRFADFWVELKKAPLSAVERVADLPGIATLETRVVFNVIVDLPGVIRPLRGRLLSVPARGFERAINGICLLRGSGFSDDRGEEVILGEAFARAHGLDPGDRIGLILNRKRESFVIVGTAISPEYVYMVSGEGDFAPDPEHFGILYVKEDYARDVLDFKDACNQFVGQLAPGHVDEVDSLLERIDRMMDPYGVLATTPRERQASHRFLSDEIKGLGVSAVTMPVIFLLVAALVLNILMSRLAERQRTIIGTLKALGYSNRRIFAHFLGFGLAVGVAGGLAGGGLGLALATGMVELYKSFFQFPVFMFRVHPDLLLTGLATSIGFALAGTAKGVWAVLRLQPAEAMRPRPPERGGAVFLERFPALWRALGFRTHIALRSVARNRARTATGVVSGALAVAIILTSLCLYDSLLYLVDFQFDIVSHSDVDIGLRDEESIAALWEGQELPGVDYAEPVLGLVCDLRKGRHTRRMAITGLSANHRLSTPVQADHTPLDIPPHGLVMSRKLAEIFDANVGDHFELTPVRGRRQAVSVPLAATLEGFLGLECYADLNYLSRIVGEVQAVNVVQMSVNPARQSDFYRAIKRLPNGQSLSVRKDAKANIEDTFIKTSSSTLGILILFAGVIAFGSVVNSSLIEIGDRLRDISTFRVLGYRPGQVAGILFRQNLTIFAAGLVVGLPLGCGLLALLSKAYDSELYRLPLVIRPTAVLITALLSFGFVLIAQGFVYREVRRLDWLEGIKVAE